MAPPQQGEHTEQVLETFLKLGADRIQALKRAGIVS
jgi:crotonobetainyl-CoA:carnitine CoA-transferase CaiB-like acyl-CoA transferase